MTTIARNGARVETLFDLLCLRISSLLSESLRNPTLKCHRCNWTACLLARSLLRSVVLSTIDWSPTIRCLTAGGVFQPVYCPRPRRAAPASELADAGDGNLRVRLWCVVAFKQAAAHLFVSQEKSFSLNNFAVNPKWASLKSCLVIPSDVKQTSQGRRGRRRRAQQRESHAPDL
jgi:hypothetical protein